MTSSIFLPRRSRAWPEPRTHLTESTILVLPEPFGPTMAVTPPLNWISVCRAKVLKPSNCRDLRNRVLRRLAEGLFATPGVRRTDGSGAARPLRAAARARPVRAPAPPPERPSAGASVAARDGRAGLSPAWRQ